MRILTRLRVWWAEAIQRDSRVTILARRRGEVIRLHVRNTGRLQDLIYPGAKLLCIDSGGIKTHGRVAGVWVNGSAALIDTSLQARAFEEALRRELIPWLRGYRIEEREVWRLGSRLDYLLSAEKKMLMELKSAVFLSKDGAATYPDTPSSRGIRHIEYLTRLRKMGANTALLFIAAHPHATHFRPNLEVDPRLEPALCEAARSGVLIKALKLHLTEKGEIALDNPDLPIRVKIN